MLSVGIIGLPNVGKSTLFNALTRGQANVSNYPFTTIDSNVGVVPVPDPRLEALAAAVHPEETTPAFVELIDIAGLVEGASRGEGLGNQFLGNIRTVDAVAHVVRCFEESDVAHVYGEVDPVRDARLVETELLLADLELLTRALDRKRRTWKADPGRHAADEARMLAYLGQLEAGVPLRRMHIAGDERRELDALGLLTGKPTLFVANVSESARVDSAEPAPLAMLRRYAASEERGGEAAVVACSARIEWELQQLEPDERRQFQRELGLEESGLDRLVAAAFELLGLVRFYTLANCKLRAWEVPAGTLAPQAAGKIHGDMERGFIRALVASHAQVVVAGGLHQLHQSGQLRTEGKEYVLRDGDVVEFLFHV